MNKVNASLKRRRTAILLCVAITVIVLTVIHFQKNVTTVILTISEASVRSITTIAANEAVYYTLNGETAYEDLVKIHKDSDGNITAFTTNPAKVNEIARDTSYLTQQNIKRLGEEGVKIPIGALTGSEVLAGFGPKINIKIIPIGSVLTQFVSQFKEAGINQSVHRIMLEIVADISIVTPTATMKVAAKTEVLVCENVIVGKVPATYLNADLFSESFKLVP